MAGDVVEGCLGDAVHTRGCLDGKRRGRATLYPERHGNTVLLAEVVAETLKSLGQTQVLQNGRMEVARDVACLFCDQQSTLTRRLKAFFGRIGGRQIWSAPPISAVRTLNPWQRES